MSERDMGLMPKGVVEEGHLAIDNEGYERPNVVSEVGSLALDVVARDPEIEAVDSLLSGGRASNLPRQRPVEPSHKRMNLDFGIGRKHINRTVTAGSFGLLPVETRLLVGVGLLNARGLQGCLKTEEQRTTFLENIVNKSQPKNIEPITGNGLSDMLESSTEQGLLTQNSSNGLGLTEAGMDYLLSDEVLLKKLKAPIPIA